MKKLAIVLAVVLALALLAVLVLPRVLDVNRYRDQIAARAEKALGRDVRLGELHLSLFPALGLKVDDVAIGALAEEGGGDLITARSLRVGARLGPLLRKRLEVTSLVLEQPSMVLARDRDGRWSVERLLAGDDEESTEETGGGELSVDRLRLSGGTLTVRDAAGEQPLEIVFSDLDVELAGIGSDAGVRFELATSFASAPEARCKLAGRATPGSDGSLSELATDLELKRMTGGLLTRLAALAGVGLEGVVGERPFDAAARLEMAQGVTALRGVVVDGADLDLRRDGGGRLNVRVPETASDGEPEPSFTVADLRLRNVRLRWRDAPRGRAPLAVELEGLDAELDGWPLTGSAGIQLSAGVAGGGRLELGGRIGPARGDAFDLAVDVSGKKLPGSLVSALAAAGGVAADGVVGERAIDVDARLESAAGGTAIPRLEVRGADLDLSRSRAGRWNFTLPEGETSDSQSSFAVRGVVLDEFRLRLRDETVGERPLDVVLDDLRVELDRLPSEGPAALRVAARVAGGGELEVSGRLGPSGAGGELPLQLSARVGALPLAVVQPMLEVLAGDGAGRADLDLTVAGEFPTRFETRGSARVAGARVTSGEPGRERLIPLDLDARFDATVSRGGEELDLRTLDVDLEGSTLALRGTVSQEGEARRFDMALAPTRLPADRLQALLALVQPDFAADFSGSEPIEIEARALGSTAAGAEMDLSGRVKVKDLRLAHPALTLPLEELAAEATLRGETVTVRGLSARIADNDLAGELTVAGFAAPRVSFDLRSQQADVGELLGLFAEDDPAAASPQEAAPLFAEGDLRIAAGTWDTLAFTNLDTRLRFQDGVATLEPAAMELYGGSFKGRVVADTNVEPAAFEIRGNAEKIDVDPFLRSNLDLGNLLFGRFTGEITARGAGSDYESILRSLEGTGTARVDDGRLGRTDLLKAVSKVAGVLGQRTLASLAGRLATESTRFERLEGRFRLAEGRMQFEEVLLDSPDFALRGKGLADLLSSALEGEFRMAFSPELSQLMRLDGSRAAEVFWDPESGKVAMPVALKGSLSAPSASVDWGAAVAGYARRRAAEELIGILGKALGDKEPQPPPAAAPPPPADARRDLGGEITATRWSGSVLFQDLKIDGVVRGAGIVRASLTAVDAGDRVIRHWDRLPQVDAYLAASDPAAFAEIRWQARIDGKELAQARLPLTLRLAVFDRGGGLVEATRVVE